MPGRLLPVAIVLSAGSLGLGYALAGRPQELWFGLVAAVLLACVWLAGAWRSWGWTPAAGLALATGLAGYGLYRQVGAGWMLAGVVFALTAWDLDHFVRALGDVDRVDDRRGHERRHLQRLLAVDALGLLLGAVALLVRTRLSLALVIVLGFLVVLGLNRALGFLRRETG